MSVPPPSSSTAEPPVSEFSRLLERLHAGLSTGTVSAEEILQELQHVAGDEYRPARQRLLRAAFAQHPEHARLGGALLNEIKEDAPPEEVLQLALHLTRFPPGSELDCYTIGGELEKNGRYEVAADFLQKAVEKHPDAVFLHHNLGVNLRNLRRLPEALESFRKAVELRPYSDVSLTMAGTVLRDLGRLPEALEFHGAAVRINPESSLALYNLGNALQEQGEFEAASKAYKQALALRPDWPELLNNFCTVLARTDRYEEALPHLLKLVRLRNNTPGDITRVIVALREINRPGEAIELAESLIRAHPENDEYRMLRAACLPRVGRSDEAVVEYQKMIARDPNNLGAYRSIIYIANYLPYEDPRQLFDFYRRYSDLIEKPLQEHRCQPQPARPFPRKLRIGYVSGDFCHHPVGTFIKPVLETHDRSAFEIFCYYNYAREDRVNKALRALPVHWRDIETIDDRALCKKIQEDQIDILVDLSGHTTRNRLNTFILKPAPVQVTMIGCMQTTGLMSMDYRITDAVLDPPGLTENLHTEKLVRMETGPLCFQPHPGAPETAPLPCLSGEPFTFGSFNNLAKVTPRVLDLWSKVLKALPKARMQVIADSGELFLRDMQHRGIPSSRFIILKRMPEAQYLAAHASVDLILDTFPFCGLTTSMNALWMGVPSVTLTGNTSASRAGASLHTRVGLDSFVAHSEQEYVQIAQRYAETPRLLAEIRTGLREKTRALWADAPAHTRELENAFREMWRLHSGETPTAPAGELPQTTLPAGPDEVAQQRSTAPGSHSAAAAVPELPSHEAGPTGEANAGRLAAEIRDCVPLADPTEKIRETALFLKSLPEPREELLKAERLLAPLPEAWKHFSVCMELWREAGFREESDRCMLLAQSFPPSAANWSWLGRSQLRAERFEDARRSFTAACEFPDVTAEATLGLACLLYEANECEAAEKLCRRTIGMSPSTWGAYLNLGNLLYQRGEFREALSVSEPAIRLSDDPKLLLNLAVYQEKCGEYLPALKSLEKVLAVEPDSAAAFLNLGNAFLFLGMPHEAAKAYSKTRLLDPSSNHTFSNYLHSINYVPETNPADFFELHREFSRTFEAPLLNQHRPHANSKDPGRRLRIAYISPDLRGHSVAYFIEPLLRHHDRTQFEVVGILSHTWKDQKTEELRGLCDQWIDAGHMSDEALAERIREEKIDIAVDLVCHSQGSRVLTFARKPAPIQITMIGMQQTTGLESMDFRVTDAFMDPPGMTEQFHSEALIRLPSALCFQAPHPSPPVSALPALKNGFITFGSFNNFAKAHHGVLRTWARVLHRVPNSRLIAVVPEGTSFESTMEQEGISADRITISPRRNTDTYLRSHENIDFVLDCFPFAGLTVSAIAAWMGVPTLTISGTTPSARAGAALMHSLELDDFIAANPDDFVEKAAALASDLPKLQDARAALRGRMTRTMTDGPAYMRHLEGAIRQAWGRWCRGEPVKTPITSEPA